MGELVEVTLEIDAELKIQAEEVGAENGLTLEEAIVLFAEETVRLGRFPFELDGLTSNIFENGHKQAQSSGTGDSNLYMEKLKRGLEQVRAGCGISKTMEELEAMEKDES